MLCYFDLVLTPATPAPTLGPGRGDLPDLRFDTTPKAVIPITESEHLRDAVIQSKITFGR